MLAEASVGQRFFVALWGSSIWFPAPFCDSRTRSHLRTSFSCHRSQAKSIAFVPSHCLGGSALPLLRLFDVYMVSHNIMRRNQEEGAGERSCDENGGVFHEDP